MCSMDMHCWVFDVEFVPGLRHTTIFREPKVCKLGATANIQTVEKWCTMAATDNQPTGSASIRELGLNPRFLDEETYSQQNRGLICEWAKHCKEKGWYDAIEDGQCHPAPTKSSDPHAWKNFDPPQDHVLVALDMCTVKEDDAAKAAARYRPEHSKYSEEDFTKLLLKIGKSFRSTVHAVIEQMLTDRLVAEEFEDPRTPGEQLRTLADVGAVFKEPEYLTKDFILLITRVFWGDPKLATKASYEAMRACKFWIARTSCNKADKRCNRGQSLKTSTFDVVAGDTLRGKRSNMFSRVKGTCHGITIGATMRNELRSKLQHELKGKPIEPVMKFVRGWNSEMHQEACRDRNVSMPDIPELAVVARIEAGIKDEELVKMPRNWKVGKQNNFKLTDITNGKNKVGLVQ